ncbi:hypothetical protein GW17_00010216 [Ensete ventricosum]|nr:hypothetical protein GW17_00010216 [Ensete ventricosum]
MGAAAAKEGATMVDAGVAATVWLKHGCALVGWGYRLQMGATTATTEARMRCDSRKRRRRYCAPTGKKEWAAAAKQRRQRGSSGSGEEWQAAAWEMAGMADGDKEGRNYDVRRRKKQPRERKEAVTSGDGAAAEAALADGKSRGDGAAAEATADEGGEMGQQQKCRRQMREEKGRPRKGRAAAAAGKEERTRAVAEAALAGGRGGDGLRGEG